MNCLSCGQDANYKFKVLEIRTLHAQWKGKIEVVATVPVKTKDDLSLAYTPGVAQPCLEIQKDINKSYELTRRWNLCAVITDGSAVLGLGDIGPEAGMLSLLILMPLVPFTTPQKVIPDCLAPKALHHRSNTALHRQMPEATFML